MDEYKGKSCTFIRERPYATPKNSTSNIDLAHMTTSKDSILTHAKHKEALLKEQTEDSSKMEPTAKGPTPQELQQIIHTENLRNQINNNKKERHLDFPERDTKLVTEQSKVDPGTAAVVAAIETGTPYIVILDNGKQATLTSSGILQSSILGLLVKIVYKLIIQDQPEDKNNG